MPQNSLNMAEEKCVAFLAPVSPGVPKRAEVVRKIHAVAADMMWSVSMMWSDMM